MKKVDAFILSIVIIISIAIIFVIVKFALSTTGKINQGNFRVNDSVLTSKIETVEKNTDENAIEISNMVFDISQKNTLDLLIAKNEEVSSMYISNITSTKPLSVGEIYISQTGYEDKYELQNDINIELYPEERENQYYVELNINNDFFKKDTKVPEDTELVKFDGTILSLLNQKISDLKFSISFDLNIIDSTGKNNVCKIKLEMPDELLITNGISVERQNLSKYLFTIQD